MMGISHGLNQSGPAVSHGLNPRRIPSGFPARLVLFVAGVVRSGSHQASITPVGGFTVGVVRSGSHQASITPVGGFTVGVVLTDCEEVDS